MANPKAYYWGTGRRKTAIARVRIREGSGKVQINNRELEDFFTEEKDRAAVLGPLELTDLRNRIDVFVNVRGGGITGQAGATSQGIARALKTMFGQTQPESAETDGEAVQGGFAKKLRDSGYLTRDSRMKERKKYGKKGARKSFQFSKR
jgi:small subunit ribosomal protein S9